MKPINSETTTGAEAVPSRIGTQLGAHGCGTLESFQIAAWLADRSPQDVDKAAVSRASRHGVGLRVITEARFPRDEKGDRLPMVVIVKGCEVTGSLSQAGPVADDLARFCTPAPRSEIEAWLAELSVIVVRRQSDELDDALRLTAYTNRLAEYPADVVHDALLKRSWQFWPSWHELEAVCRELSAPRRAMMDALRMQEALGVSASTQREQEPPEPPVTPERVTEILAEYGFTPARLAAVASGAFNRAARTLDDVDTPPDASATAHWSDTAPPNDPRWDELRRARQASPVTQSGKESAP